MSKSIFPVLAAMGVSALLPPSLVAQDAPAEAAQPVDAAAVRALAASLETALSRLPRSATQADAEAAIVFAIDQAQQPLPTVIAALSAINRAKLSPVYLAAVDAIRATRGRLVQRGTGSIAGASALLLGAGPGMMLNGGSGTSDYVR